MFDPKVFTVRSFTSDISVKKYMLIHPLEYKTKKMSKTRLFKMVSSFTSHKKNSFLTQET